MGAHFARRFRGHRADASAPLGIVPVGYLAKSDGDISSTAIPAAGLAIALVAVR